MRSPYSNSAMSEGIAQADNGANPAWKAAALATLKTVAENKPTLTSDDVLESLDPTIETRDLRALGPVFIRAEKDGLIEITKDVVKSRFGKNRWKRPVWKSLIYAG